RCGRDCDANTFATINEDATAEAMFRKAVSTIEGVKADSLFSYQSLINLVALCIMLPLSYILTPRWFHKNHEPSCAPDGEDEKANALVHTILQSPPFGFCHYHLGFSVNVNVEELHSNKPVTTETLRNAIAAAPAIIIRSPYKSSLEQCEDECEDGWMGPLREVSTGATTTADANAESNANANSNVVSTLPNPPTTCGRHYAAPSTDVVAWFHHHDCLSFFTYALHLLIINPGNNNTSHPCIPLISGNSDQLRRGG
ncbi:hypothetical protein EV359DRAFT_69035, partial [Lentinula novae-zelandiae]